MSDRLLSNATTALYQAKDRIPEIKDEVAKEVIGKLADAIEIILEGMPRDRDHY